MADRSDGQGAGREAPSGGADGEPGSSARREALAEAYERGLAAEKSGDGDAAAAAYAEALTLDPADHAGVSVRLAALGRGPTPDGAPAAYVETLFDQHADTFDLMLVDQLGYDAPLQLADLLRPILAEAEPPVMLDLGCGTGLAAEALAELVGPITGVDLSERMIEIAEEKEVYSELFVADALGFLEATEGRWGLITATDMLPYMGDLGPLIAAAGARLDRGGLVALSTETLPDAVFEGQDYVVGPRQRFAHRPPALERWFREAGLSLLRLEPIVVRYDEGAPTRGHLAIATLP